MKIEIEGLHFSYPNGVKAIQGIDLAIHPGEQVAIIGQNGSGKTTLVKHFNGLLKPSQGRVMIGDWDTSEHTVAQMASRVGYVFQNPDEQLFTKTVEMEIAFGPKNLGYAEEEIERLVNFALSLTELERERTTNPYDLSPTWRKMVSMASVIAMDTPIVVFDEPTTGQDAVSIRRIAHVVKTLKEQNKTVITITHDIDFCAENFQRVIALAEGKILLDGSRKDVFSQQETLAKTYVDPPQLTRLGTKIGLSQTVTDEDSFLRTYRETFDPK
ncbi:MAG: ABC transporter ATP-binding protein [Anaerolineales bacterium]